MTEPCPRSGRWICGCKFEPRYDRKDPADPFYNVWRKGTEAIEAGVKRVTYVRDVRVRCGRTIERTKP